VLEAIVNLIPEGWLHWEEVDDTPCGLRCIFTVPIDDHSEILLKGSTKCTRKLIWYAVIPRCAKGVEREEFLNVGIDTFCKAKYIKVHSLDVEKNTIVFG
jgi:hypothetical protein